MLAELVAVCLLGVSDGEVHHKRGHDNYYIKDFVCSTKNLPVEPDSCGKVKEFLEGTNRNWIEDFLKPMTPEELVQELKARAAAREFWDLCCQEA